MIKFFQTQQGKEKETGCEIEEYLDTAEELSAPKVDSLEAGITKKNATTPHILVIDDDPLFRAQFRYIAKKRNLAVSVCSTVEEMQVMSNSNLFDIAIVDYYLDDLKTYLRGTDIAGLMESTPVILMSSSDHGIENNTPFPQSVRKFVNKKIGIDAILNTALQTAVKVV